MAFRTLHITLGSGENLQRAYHHVRKMDVYAFVSISDVEDDKASRQEARTTVDPRGDVNPRWNCQIEFIVDEAALQANRLTLDFKLTCKRRFAADEDIAELSVPVKDLLDRPAAEDRSVTYSVRRPNGKPKGGNLTFSYKFGDKQTAPPPPPAQKKLKPKSGSGSGLLKPEPESNLAQPSSAQTQNGETHTSSGVQPKPKRKRSSG